MSNSGPTIKLEVPAEYAEVLRRMLRTGLVTQMMLGQDREALKEWIEPLRQQLKDGRIECLAFFDESIATTFIDDVKKYGSDANVVFCKGEPSYDAPWLDGSKDRSYRYGYYAFPMIVTWRGKRSAQSAYDKSEWVWKKMSTNSLNASSKHFTIEEARAVTDAIQNVVEQYSP